MIKRLSCIFALSILLCHANAAGEEFTLRVIPNPNSVSCNGSYHKADSKTKVSFSDSALADEAGFLKENLSEIGKVSLDIDNAISNPEGYILTVEEKHISIQGGSDAGVFYGIQTLIQENRNGGILCGRIEDSPRYAWRGYMLDEARHFSGEEKVLKLLDIMAGLKLNVFHWHLTDAQGWRIEIKGYPRLTEVGAIGNNSDPSAPAAFYTQKQIKKIIEYAAVRHITIIPEIDMPGHASAANRAYPEFSGGGTDAFPDFTFNPGKEGTYSFLTDILREVAGLFPGDYLHIGGDEVSFGSEAWSKDPYVNELKNKEGLQSLKDIEGCFLHRIADSVKVLGKTVVCWDDAMDVGLGSGDEIIMWWRHDRPDKLRKALESHSRTILCPRKPLYFDFVQYDSHKVGRKWDGFCPLEDVYGFPENSILSWSFPSSVSFDSVSGIQANLWSELTQNSDRVDYMTFPRLCALAEAAWTNPEGKDYVSFAGRMEDAYHFLDKEGIYYFDPRNPQRHPEPAGPQTKQK